jgi:hypothetical protein
LGRVKQRLSKASTLLQNFQNDLGQNGFGSLQGLGGGMLSNIALANDWYANEGYGPCSQGNIQINGFATFFATTASLPGFVKNNPDTNAGDLPSLPVKGNENVIKNWATKNNIGFTDSAPHNIAVKWSLNTPQTTLMAPPVPG